MQEPQPSAAVSRYIVRAAGEDDALARFLASLDSAADSEPGSESRSESGIRLVDTIGPSAGPPHTAVIETDAPTVERLRRNRLYQLTIEPDQPLSLSS